MSLEDTCRIIRDVKEANRIDEQEHVHVGDWSFSCRAEIELLSQLRGYGESTLTIVFGERCQDFEETCICCQRWKLLDQLTDSKVLEC